MAKALPTWKTVTATPTLLHTLAILAFFRSITPTANHSRNGRNATYCEPGLQTEFDMDPPSISPLMRKGRRKTAYDVDERDLAVRRRQRSREKSAVERGGRGIKRGTLHDVQRSKEKSTLERGGRGIKRGTLHHFQRRRRNKEMSVLWAGETRAGSHASF